MATIPFTKPVEDSVAKVDDAVAVGEDLEFQRSWWRFSNIIWSFFLLLLVCDLAGLFGRGFLAKAKAAPSNQSFLVEYERIERTGTPSIMTIHFNPEAVHDGKIQLFLSESVIKKLGAQRISPQPASSALTSNGVNYTFPADGTGPAIVELSLSPSFPGPQNFNLHLADGSAVAGKIFVMP